VAAEESPMEERPEIKIWRPVATPSIVASFHNSESLKPAGSRLARHEN
jgi:hypothetical protein